MACPKCDSRDVILFPSGEYQCKKCGYRWSIPQPQYIWIENEIKKAKLFEKFIESNIDSCEELLLNLGKELDEKNARILAMKILSQRIERKKLTQYELNKIYEELKKCINDNRHI